MPPRGKRHTCANKQYHTHMDVVGPSATPPGSKKKKAIDVQEQEGAQHHNDKRPQVTDSDDVAIQKLAGLFEADRDDVASTCCSAVFSCLCSWELHWNFAMMCGSGKPTDRFPIRSQTCSCSMSIITSRISCAGTLTMFSPVRLTALLGSNVQVLNA